MARYPKIWTSILHDDWYRGLSIIERSVWLQMIMIACAAENEGFFGVSSVTELAKDLKGERHTIGRILSRFQDDGKVRLWSRNGARMEHVRVEDYQKSSGRKIPDSLTIEIVNYNKYNKVKRFRDTKKWSKNGQNSTRKTMVNVEILRISTLSAEKGGFAAAFSAWLKEMEESGVVLTKAEELLVECMRQINKIWPKGFVPTKPQQDNILKAETRINELGRVQNGGEVTEEWRGAVNDYYRAWQTAIGKA